MKYYNDLSELNEEGMEYISSLMRSYQGTKVERLEKTAEFVDMSLGIAKAGAKNLFDSNAIKHFAFLYYVRNVLIKDMYNQIDGDGPEFITTWN